MGRLSSHPALAIGAALIAIGGLALVVLAVAGGLLWSGVATVVLATIALVGFVFVFGDLAFRVAGLGAKFLESKSRR